MKTYPKKKWRVASEDSEVLARLQETMGTNEWIARLLHNRHIESAEEGQSFLYDGMDSLLDPFLLAGMEIAVARLVKAVEAQERIVIYGDYDVDGITATSLLYRMFMKLGATVQYYIPERQSEGYGLNLDALEHLITTGADVVITVDCGISSADLVDQVKDRLDLIITDHHTPPERVPDAVAVINPKQVHCPYPDKNLSGVGVAFKLASALWQRLYGRPYQEDLDIVALGTVADVVPLVGENRIMVREGLRRINECPQLGIDRLVDVAGYSQNTVRAGTISFTLAPRLNAAGRVTHATEGVRLLITDSYDEAQSIAEDLQETNAERQSIEREIVSEAIQQVLAQGNLAEKVIVVAGEGWHPGVIGIVASRLVERFYRPTLVITVTDGVGKGSCRSIEGFDMYDALCACDDLLIQFGGHKQAAGFSMEAVHVDALRERLTAYCQQQLTASDYIPIVDIDCMVSPEEITVERIEELALLEPYGMGNPTPVFALDIAVVKQIFYMGAEKQHIKFVLQAGDRTLEAVAWNGRELGKTIYLDQPVRVAFQAQINEWNGDSKPQLLIQDIQPRECLTPSLSRDAMVDMYKMIRPWFSATGIVAKDKVELQVLQLHHEKYRPMDLLLAIEVCKELGIIEEECQDGVVQYRWHSVSQKLDLFKSITFLRYSS